MKRYKSKEFEEDCRICGHYNSAPLNIARAVSSKVLGREKTHLHEDDFEYYFFLKGEGILEINGEKHAYQAGDVFLVESGEKHKMLEIKKETDYITIRSNINPENKVVFD